MLVAAGSAAAQAAGAEVVKQTVANPYGLEAMWAQGDVVAKSTLVIMIIMSIG
ncbi:MAG: MotA/TolQ/ExbB proton channel family protein, partial [Betaproteobacteria bacterium]